MKTNILSEFSKYDQALNVLSDKLNEFNQECLDLGEDNPIEHIKYRIKTKGSIKDKLLNKFNLEYTDENIDNLNDVVGVRIVCTFISDIEKVINYIKNDLGFTILNIKDYISNPKDNGYSSYHVIISVPIINDGKKEFVKAEIQVRTTAMDVLSTQSHKISYKQKYIENSELEKELEDSTTFVSEFDKDLNSLYLKKQNVENKKVNREYNFCDKDFDIFLYKYKLALDILNNNFISELMSDYYMTNEECPIEHIKWRLKPVNKIIEKVKTKGYDLTLQNIEDNIHDIGALKIVCLFLDDLEDLKEKIRSYEGFKVIEEDDYVSNPKDSGYRSYHFTVEVPVEINGNLTSVKVEIQIRTMMMDFWANVEHKMCFKKNVDEDIKFEFKKMSDLLWEKELKMNMLARNANSKDSIRKRISKN